MTLLEKAKLAYETYCKAVGGKAWNGDTLPAFENLDARIAQAWVITVVAITEAVLTKEREYQMKRAALEEEIAALEAEDMPDDAHTDWPWDQQEYIDTKRAELNDLQEQYA